MATTAKNFRIKQGLVVEGSTGTINGQNILTETGGDAYILNLVGGATLVKSVSSDFKVTNGGELQIDDSVSDLARTGDITDAIDALDTDDIEEGSSNLYFTDARAKTSAAMLLTGNMTTRNNITITGDENGLTITAENGVADSDTDDLTEGTNNLYFTNQRALDATSAAYDAAGAAATAQTNAQNYANGLINDTGMSMTSVWSSFNTSSNIETAQSNAEDYADGLASNYDPAGSAATAESNANLYTDNSLYPNGILGNPAFDLYGAASTAEGNANTYTDTAINGLDTDDIEEGATNQYFTTSRAVNAVTDVLGSGLTVNAGQIVVDTSTIANKTYVDDAIDNLVDGAPGLLDTLNEIAAAINDDENYFTTVSTAINAKQDTLTAGANIDITSNTISVTGLDTDDISEGTNLYFTDERAIDAVSDADIYPNAVIIDNVAKQVAATTGNIVTAAATTALAWAKADYRSGKFTVKVKNGSHTEISEILVTLDTSDNVAITEYGVVGTNGSLSTVSADVSGTDVRIRVTPANDNSEVMVVGTLLI